MVPGLRLVKKLLLLFIFLAIIGGISLWAVRTFSIPVTTPTPDPIAQLKPLEVVSTKLFTNSDQSYDLLVQIKNPNTKFGSGDVRYTIMLDDQKITGSSYILPGQIKYIVHPAIRTTRPVISADLKISSVAWQELDPLAVRGVQFAVTNSNLSEKRLQGFILNNSDFDVGRVDVAVVLFDANNEPLAVNRSTIYTFLAHTTRGFEVSWPSAFEKTAARSTIEAQANLFENSAFIRTYGGQEKFQAY